MAHKTDIKRCPVAFNLADPFQDKLYKHTQQFTNFSAYIKRLIQKDMEGAPATQNAPVVEIKVDNNFMNGLL